MKCRLAKRNILSTTTTTAASPAGGVAGIQKELINIAIVSNQSGNDSGYRIIATENSTNVGYRDSFRVRSKWFPIETIVLIVMFSICTIVYIGKWWIVACYCFSVYSSALLIVIEYIRFISGAITIRNLPSFMSYNNYRNDNHIAIRFLSIMSL